MFGRTLQVSPFRRGEALSCIYTQERPDFCSELPNWRFNAAYCAGMTLGPPEISIDVLDNLAAVLALLGAPQSGIADFRPSTGKERDGAEKSRAKSRAARPGVRAPEDLLVPVEQSTQGLVEELADLLRAAVEREETTKASKGGDGEQQDHR